MADQNRQREAKGMEEKPLLDLNDHNLQVEGWPAPRANNQARAQALLINEVNLSECKTCSRIKAPRTKKN